MLIRSDGSAPDGWSTQIVPVGEGGRPVEHEVGAVGDRERSGRRLGERRGLSVWLSEIPPNAALSVVGEALRVLAMFPNVTLIVVGV